MSNTDHITESVLPVMLTWILTGAVTLFDSANGVVTQANVSFVLSCIVSILAAVHYYVQIRKNKKPGRKK